MTKFPDLLYSICHDIAGLMSRSIDDHTLLEAGLSRLLPRNQFVVLQRQGHNWSESE